MSAAIDERAEAALADVDHVGIRSFVADWVSTAADSWRLAWWQATRAGVASGGRFLAGLGPG
jgi:hypothetical protein